jgi:hypothetical protein
MNKPLIILLFSCVAASAQLAVTVSTPKVTGQKAVVELNLKNGLTNQVESARAICLLFDDQGKIVGQSTKWVVGQNKKVLEPDAKAEFNFVITTPQPLVSSNLTAKVMFSKVNLDSGKVADVRQVVQVMPATSGDESKPR